MLSFLRRITSPARRRRLLETTTPRVVRIHRVDPEPPGADPPQFVRIAYEFTDPPGPFSLQFFEADPASNATALALKPDDQVAYYESTDEARTRAFKLDSGEIIWTRHP